MELIDLSPLETWIALEEDIQQRTGLQASVFNAEGIRINTSTPKWANKLCPAIKATDKGQSFICATAHMNIANSAKASKEAVIEECDAGLIKLVVPVMVDNEFIGSVSGCGQVLGDGDVDPFLINKITEIEESRVETLSQDLPTISVAASEALAQYIKERIAAIISAHQGTAA